MSYINMLPLLWRSVGTVALFVLMIAIMVLVESPLFDISLELIKQFSANWDNSSFTSFMKVYTNYGAVILVGITTFYAFLTGPKIKQIMFLNALLLSWTLCSFFKNLHHQLRPCWADLTIKVMGSDSDYGNPSGHSAGCGAALGAALLLYLFENEASPDFYLNEKEHAADSVSRTGSLYSMPSKIVISIIGLSAYIAIVFSRVYLGAHALNQVCYGFLLSMWCVGAVFYSFRPELVTFYKRIYKERAKLELAGYVVAFIAVLAFMLSAHIVLYVFLKVSDVQLDENTVKHIAERISTFTKDVPLDKGLVNAGLGFIVVGAHFGIIFNARYININPIQTSLDIVFWKRLARFVVVLVVAAAVPLPAIVYLPSSPALGYWWVKTVFPSVLLGFVMFGLGDFLMRKLRMLPEESIANDEIGLLDQKAEPMLGSVDVVNNVKLDGYLGRR